MSDSEDQISPSQVNSPTLININDLVENQLRKENEEYRQEYSKNNTLNRDDISRLRDENNKLRLDNDYLQNKVQQLEHKIADIAKQLKKVIMFMNQTRLQKFDKLECQLGHI